MTVVALHAPFAGWLGPLSGVPDSVFADGMMGEGFAIDPTEGVLRAPADGIVVSVPVSAHAITLRLDNGTELLLHIGLETVALAGRGFAAKAAAGDRVRRGDTLIAFDLDEVARDAKDMITPIVAISGNATCFIDRPGRLVAAGDAIGTVSAAERAAVGPVAEKEYTRTFRITAPHGIHARPAARIVALLKRFDAHVALAHAGRETSGTSIVGLLGLAGRYDDSIEARASGADAVTALDALAAFAGERFGDPVEAARVVQADAGYGGVCASPGIAIGTTFRLRGERVEVAEAGTSPQNERAALTAALETVAKQLPQGDSGIADAHRALLADPMLREAADGYIQAGKTAAFAWRRAISEAAETLRSTGDPIVVERVADLEDLDAQVVAVLLDLPPFTAPTLPSETILIADDLLPSQFLAIDRDRLAGICTARGGPTAHVAILAAAAAIPMVVAAGAGVLAIPDGTTIMLDADHGRLDADPDAATLRSTRAIISDRHDAQASAKRAALNPAVTRDGTHIEVFANLGSLADATDAVSCGAEGCGLLRTEFLFLDRPSAPDEDEQRTLYARIAASLGGRPLIVRTLDIGGDKPVPYLPRTTEDNPALGLRGIRLGLARPALLAMQLRAILRGVPGAQCRIMLPMISQVAELRAVRVLLDAAIAETGRTGPVELGVMIETPAAAILADQLAREADFLSIGTNDLTQYTLAADRGNAAVSALLDAFHPSVLRLIAATADGARRHGRWVGVCGGLASDPLAAAILIGLGITELSVTTTAIPALKAHIRTLDIEKCRALAHRACDALTASEVRALADDTA